MPRCPTTGRFQKGGAPETERPPNMMTPAIINDPPEIKRPEADLLLRQLRLTNEKLRQRAVRMVCRITGCDEIEAADALRQSEDVGDANVKLAVLIVGGLTAEEGANILNAHNGHLRHVLKHIKF